METCFNPDWAPHFIPTPKLPETQAVHYGFNPDWAPHFIPTLRLTVKLISRQRGFNPDWAPHFIPTAVPDMEQVRRTMFQSRLGTTLHSDSIDLRHTCTEWNVSIPTGHHTSFRL